VQKTLEIQKNDRIEMIKNSRPVE